MPFFLLTINILLLIYDAGVFDRIDDEDVAMCISKGWYLQPNGTWLDLAERDLSNHSTVEVLEEEINGLSRMFSILKYPVKLNEKYVYPHNSVRCEQPTL